MTGNRGLARAIAALCFAFWAGAALAQAPAPCPANATALADGAKLRCTCEAGAAGSVFGSARYTTDSSICTAAKHAGKPPGPIDLVVGDACASFPGSVANEVTTSSWSTFEKSFNFGDSLLPCPAVAAAPAPAALPSTASPLPVGVVANCPSFITQSASNKPGDSLTCICDKALDLNTGAAYGTERYSNDSSICIAARHAGKLPKPGGTVTVYVAEGCGKFVGSARNDITTRSWGSTVPGTIAFVTPAPDCAAPPAAPPAAAATPPARPTPPAGPSPMIAWEARVRTYAAALPEPLPGWTPQPPATRVENSAMMGREVTAYRIYRIGSHPAGLNSVDISISNNPDGTARYPIELWNSAAKRKEAGATMLKLAGRDAMESKSPAAEAIKSIYFLTKSNLFVSVTWQEPHMTRDKSLEYVKVLNFAKIEALATK